jgi:hypothetical protein
VEHQLPLTLQRALQLQLVLSKNHDETKCTYDSDNFPVNDADMTFPYQQHGNLDTISIP